jgi:hypothetical protein
VVERRKRRRFDLRLPCQLVRIRGRFEHRDGETKNISSTGALLKMGFVAEVGDALEYVIRMPAPDETQDIRIRCFGTVVRCDLTEIAVAFQQYEFERISGKSRSRLETL